MKSPVFLTLLAAVLVTLPVPLLAGENESFRIAPEAIANLGLRFAAVETKRDGISEPSPHQQIQMDQINAAGGTTMVINATNLDELEAWLEGNG